MQKSQYALTHVKSGVNTHWALLTIISFALMYAYAWKYPWEGEANFSASARQECFQRRVGNGSGGCLSSLRVSAASFFCSEWDCPSGSREMENILQKKNNSSCKWQDNKLHMCAFVYLQRSFTNITYPEKVFNNAWELIFGTATGDVNPRIFLFRLSFRNT